MSTWLKALGIFVVILICVAVIAFAFAVPSLEKKAREQIVEQLRTKLDAKVELKLVRLSSLWPLGLRLQDLKVLPANKQYRFEVDRMYLRYHYLFSSQIEVNIEKPRVDWFGSAPVNEKKTEAPPPAPQDESGPPPWVAGFISGTGVELFVREGAIHWQKDETTKLGLEKFNVDISKAKLLNENEPIRAVLDAELHYVTPMVSGQTTIAARTSDLKVNLEPLNTIGSQDSELQVGGLVLKASGLSRLKEGVHDWKINANVENLQSLPRPPDFLPAQNWKGKVFFNADVHHDAIATKAQGQVKFEQVSADLRWDSPEIKAQGPAHLDVQAAFDWAGSENYSVKDASIKADLTQASFQYSNLFKKAAGTDLSLEFKGAVATKALDVQSLALKLFNLTLQAKGNVPLQGNGKLQWQTSQTSLAGWEKLILPMAQTPLQGTLEARGAVSGSFALPKEMAIEISKLSLKDFKGQVKYKSADGQLIIEGPVTAGVEAKLATQGENVRAADVSAHADLGALVIQKVGLFEKKPGEVFQINLTAKQQKDDIGIEKSEFRLPFMTMNVGGRVHNPKDPSFDLNIKSDVSSLDALKAFVPSMKDLPVSGSLKSQIELNGKLATEKPWHDWPLKVSGAVNWTTPKLVIGAKRGTASEGSTDEASSAADKAPPAGFLQKGYLTENLNVSIGANVGKFVKEKLEMTQTSINGRIAGGKYTGALSSFGFGGQVQLKNTVVPLFEPNPTIVSDIHFNDIKIESILEFLKPEIKDIAKGPSHGDVHVESLMPDAPQFMNRLKAKGQVGSENVWINTTSLNQMINDKISQVPGVGKNAVRLDPLQGRLMANFTLEKEKAEPLTIDGFDRSGSELHLRGSANLQQTVDLTGEFRWASAPFSGCLKEGNSDEKGRVVVPLTLRGPITSPSWSFATDVIAKMGEKALRCEAVKALQKQIPQNIPGNLGDEIGKKLKDLLGH